MIDAALRCTLWNAIFKLELLVFNLSLLFPNQPSPRTIKTTAQIATDRANQWLKNVGHILIISETNYLIAS